MYHISDCKKYSRCPRLFYLEANAEKQEYRPYVRLDEEITLLAAEKLGITKCYKGERGAEPQEALDALKNEEWLLKACNQATQDYVKALEELVRDMWREITTCPDYMVPPCMTDGICERVRNLGVEMGGDDDE